jgi:hypothetical protein
LLGLIIKQGYMDALCRRQSERRKQRRKTSSNARKNAHRHMMYELKLLLLEVVFAVGVAVGGEEVAGL